ncbi:MAG: RdgB/HAM1 family non-canonical purine NTP pyrophosphatase [Actinobacteria bacterium]|nr:RdgB/HAM1 family non-canonical purine NTP pyrophosphatase [Actinomycetota bacterium]
MPPTFVLATHNAHKVEEFQAILGGASGLTIGSYDGPEPIEDGTTFGQNALIKARAAAEHTGLVALADDSGLCVDVLNGAPGIFSARWAGPKRGDEANLNLLLEQLADVRDEDRTAFYVCVIAVVIPARENQAPHEFVVEAQWHGRLARAPRGEYGFGYDPIFVPEGSELTAAEMNPTEKNNQSHRALALAKLKPLLAELT